MTLKISRRVREKKNMDKKRKTIVVPMDGFGSTASRS